MQKLQTLSILLMVLILIGTASARKHRHVHLHPGSEIKIADNTKAEVNIKFVTLNTV